MGGLLALSRAFGDAYLKGSDQFEGVSFYASDTYASGFGEAGIGEGRGLIPICLHVGRNRVRHTCPLCPSCQRAHHLLTHSPTMPPRPPAPPLLPGLIAEPYTSVTDLTDEDSWLIVTSDGLLANEERGGGGGLRWALP